MTFHDDLIFNDFQGISMTMGTVTKIHVFSIQITSIYVVTKDIVMCR